jgi:arabinogalactan oligomer/maltooligosaccharide transport system substrate-binding protein
VYTKNVSEFTFCQFKIMEERIMKKLFALGCVLVLSLAFLVACGGDSEAGEEIEAGPETADTEPGDDEETAFGGETITLWIDQAGYAEALVAALSDRFPDTKFEFEELGSTYTTERLALAGPAGVGADIILFPQDHISDAINQSLLLPLGPDLAGAMNGRIPEASLDTVRLDDHYFAVPLRMNSIGLFYNSDLLEEHGLEVAGSFEELIEQAGEFNDPANNQFLIRWEAGNAFFNYFFLTSFGYELFGPDHNDPDAINFDTPAALEGLEFFLSMRDILPVPYGDLNWDTVHGAFVAGEVPYIITGPWSISDINDNGDFEWGVTKIPTINGNQPITFSDNNVAAVSAFTEHPDLSRAVLEFMMSDEGLQILYDEVGAIPALIDTSIIDGLSDDPFLAGIITQAEYSHPMPIIPEMSQFWAPAESMYRSVWEGLLTPAEAVENAMNDFEAARALADN